MTTGFCAIDNAGEPPSNDHNHSDAPFNDVSINDTDPPAVTTCVSATKSATGTDGNGDTLTYNFEQRDGGMRVEAGFIDGGHGAVAHFLFDLRKR